MKHKFIFLILSFWVYQKIPAQKSFTEQSGDVLQFVLPATALGSTFIYPDNDHPHWQFLKTYATSIVSVYTLKYIVDETRPNGGHLSFPSGHTASAFSGAAFLQMRYGWKIGLPAYLLASYVGYTRIKAQKHYIWDVAAGAAIGIGSTLLFVKAYQHKNISFEMGQNHGFYVAMFSYKF